jgi:glycosyltransferase involved in cell wall biosynthesis
MMTPRIGIFYRDLLGPGGIPRETELLAKALDAVGASVFAYCYRGETVRRLQGLEGSGVIVRSYPCPAWGRNCLAAPRAFARLLRHNLDNLDVLLLMGSFIPENAPVARMLRRRGLTYVYSPGDGFHPALWHGRQGLVKRVYERVFERQVAGGASAIRLYSWAQARHLDERGYLDNGRFFVLKEGIDREDVERTLGTGADVATPPPQLTFGFLGRLDIYQKGLDRLLQAWADHKRCNRPGRLVVAGSGTHQDLSSLKALASSLDLPDFDLRGPCYGASKYELLSRFSVLVHPSRHEGIPRVIREALALGCPVIVTPDTNLADVVADSGAGWVVGGSRASVRDALEDVAASVLGLERYRKGALAAANALDWDLVGSTFVAETSRRLRLS